MKLSGLYTALITPFKNQQLDEEGLIHNLFHQDSNGVEGVVVLGTTGETPTLTTDEKNQVIRIAKKHFKGTLIVGTGSYCTETTIENNKKAAQWGADAVLVVTPYYNKPRQAGLIKHFEAIADASPIPVILYHAPERCSIGFEVSTIVKLSEHPNIIGIKECGPSLQIFGELSRLIKPKRPDFALLTGDDIHLFSTMLLGGDGAISVVSNLIPDKISTLIRALKDYKIDEARALYFQLLPFIKAAFLETNPIPIKEAMNYCGFAAGECRLPLTTIEEAHRSILIETIEHLSLVVNV